MIQMELSIAKYATSSDPYTISTIFLLIILFFLSLRWISNNIYFHSNTTKAKAPPEPRGTWPLIGHLLLLLKNPKPLHITLGNIADEYGPVFAIKLGVHRILVVSRCDMAKECLTINDKVFANRPKSSLAMRILGHDFSMLGFSFYGPYWRQVRKISITHLLSNNRLEMLKQVRESEVKAAIKDVHDLWIINKKSGVLVDMKKWLGDINVNLILRMLVGKSLVIRGRRATSAEKEAEDEFRKASRDFFELAGDFAVGEAFPALRWFDLNGKEKDMKRVAQVLEDIAQDWLEEHKKNRSIFRNIHEHEQDENDFMGTMLSVLDQYEEIRSTYGSERANKATCLYDQTILNCMAVYRFGRHRHLNNNHDMGSRVAAQQPRSPKKGSKRNGPSRRKREQVKESDIKSLPYLQSIIKETLRLYPPIPHLLPHESMEDCCVGGYQIPAGTRVLINASKIQRDPHVWPYPDQFLPERFLTSAKDIGVRGQDFELIPFGSGRRMCPGVTLALQVMQLALASLLHGFDIETPSNEPLDMRESSGLSSPKASLLEVILTPRLSSELYE